MQTSANGRKFIESYEGLILQAYDDVNDQIVPAGGEVHGTLTIGYGHTNAAGPPTVNIGDVITKDQADQILSNDLHKVENQVSSLVKVSLTQNQFDALVSFQFNTGALGKSSALVFLNQGNYAEAADRLTLYVYSKGKLMAGLQKRRQAEKQIFLTKDGDMPISQTPMVPSHTPSTIPAAPQLPLQLPAFDFQDIDATLQAIDGYLPTLLNTIGLFYPPAAAVAKFLPLIHVLIQGVHTVSTATNTDTATAVQTVAQHLVPGEPNAPALS